ncbi:hypothetical protein HRbin34_00492 [bacterium HR34]|nr:hypothetical protein HRbin34_00492 [bacterium HR34]
MTKKVYLKIPRSIRKHLRELKSKLKKASDSERVKIEEKIKIIKEKYSVKK